MFTRCLDILFPPTELTCDAAAARAGWAPSRPDEYCGRCGATVSSAAVTEHGCPYCVSQRIAWNGVWRLGGYEEPLSDWVRNCKFRRMWSWGRWFGAGLARTPATPEREVVVPVPLHWRRRMVRGYNHAELIAKGFARARRLPVFDALRRIRATRQQSLIASKREREANVRGAFALRRGVDLSGATVWLVDDVKTTGATARACARLLRKAGARRVNLIVAAVAEPGSQGSSGGPGLISV